MLFKTDSLNVLQYTSVEKLIILMEEMEFDADYEEMINYNTVIILYNDSSYRSLHVDFPTRELIINATSVTSKDTLMDLHRVEPYIAFCPSNELKRFQEYWRTIASRHNFTYMEPIDAYFMLFGNIVAFQKLAFSMHRSMSTYFIIVPTNRPRPLGYLLVDPFDALTWICVLLAILTVLMLLWIVDRTRFILSRTVLELVQILINNPHERSRPAVHRFVVTMFITGSFILRNSYESLITATITRPSFYPPLDNLDIINRTCNPMLKLVTSAIGFEFMYETRNYEKDGISTECFVGPHKTVEYAMELWRNNPKYEAKSFKKSPVQLVPFPVLGFLASEHHQSMKTLLSFYAATFAQAGLFHFVEDERSDLKPDDEANKREALLFGELILVWRLAIYGWSLSSVVFFVELALFNYRSFLKYLGTCCSLRWFKI